MERNKKTKVIAIVALIIGVIGLSIGFAAFSSILNIQSSANVKPDNSTMNVIFSSALDKAEVKKLVNFYIPTWKNGELDDHLYLVENTNFSKKDNSKFDGYWL